MGQAKHAPTTRRALLAEILALSSAAGGSAIVVAHGAALADPIRPDEHEDAELLAFEAPIAALAAIADGLLPELRRLDKTAQAEAAPRPDHTSPEWAAYVIRHNAANDRLGFEAMQQVWERADNQLLEAIRVIERIPARTFDGLRMKARMCEHGDDDLVHSIVDDLIAIDKAMRS